MMPGLGRQRQVVLNQPGLGSEFQASQGCIVGSVSNIKKERKRCGIEVRKRKKRGEVGEQQLQREGPSVLQV